MIPDFAPTFSAFCTAGNLVGSQNRANAMVWASLLAHEYPDDDRWKLLMDCVTARIDPNREVELSIRKVTDLIASPLKGLAKKLGTVLEPQEEAEADTDVEFGADLGE
jgi:hypothetical protein